jgi:hypothetical protein
MLRVLLMSVVEHAMPYCVTDECESDDDEIDKRLRRPADCACVGSAIGSLVSFQAGQPVADDNVPGQHETVCALAQNELDGLVSWHGMVNGPCTYRVAGVKLL